jgi:ElaB/YqjD/DUF883 family membrane-anchored ribosome-binding protein
MQSGDKRLLGKAITLVESRKPEHREQAEELLRQAANGTGVQAQELREKAMQLLEQVKSQTQVLQDQAMIKAREAGEATQEFVKENPWKALGVAAGLGLLLGAMLKNDAPPVADVVDSEPPKLR